MNGGQRGTITDDKGHSEKRWSSRRQLRGTQNGKQYPICGAHNAGHRCTYYGECSSAAAGRVRNEEKRGRPRKYAADGSLATTLSPMPISSSIPLSLEYSPWKRGTVRSVETAKKSQKFDSQSQSQRQSSAGNLTDVFTVSL